MEGADGVDVCLWGREASAHRIDGHVAGTQSTPRFDTLVPCVFVQALDADPGINTKIFAIAASFFEIAVELLNIRFHVVVRCPTSRHPPITEPCSALEGRLGSTPEPDGDGTLHGQRIDPGVVNDVVRGLVWYQRLGPELAQHLNLFFSPASTRLKFLAERVVLDVIPVNPDAQTQTSPTQHRSLFYSPASTRLKVLAERVVLDVIPANPDAKTQTSPTQHVNLCSLLGDQGCLALRQEEKSRHQSESRGDGSEKSEEYHGLMERMLISIRPREFWFTIRMRPEHVVVDEQIVIAKSLGGLGVIFDGLNIIPEFGLGKHNTVLHSASSYICD